MPRAASSTGKQSNPVVKEVVDRFNSSWQYAVANQHQKWLRNYKLYNNKRAIISYEGTTNTFVPMSFSVVETLTAALADGRPSIDFAPQDMYAYIASYVKNGVKPDLKALNSLFDYYWDCDNWDLRSVKTIRGAFLYGTSAEWVYWDDNKPRVINLPIRDAIIDPTLTDPMQLLTDPDDHYGGRRFLTTLDALKEQQIIDPATGKLTNRYKNLSKVTAGAVGGEETDKQLKENIFLGSVGETGNMVEVLEIWDGKRIRSTANRTVEIEDRDNKLGIIPLVLNRFIADESVIYGKAIIDVIAQPQELLNDIMNQRVDAVTDALAPNYELDPIYADYLDMIDNAPGTIHPFRPGSLVPVQKPSVPNAAFNETAELKNEIREATAADQVIMGVNTSFHTSATEIKAQLAQAGQRFDLYVMMLEKEAFYQRAKIVYKMMRMYLKDMQLVPTNSVDGPKFYVFDPKQYDDTYEPKIKLQASVDSQKHQEQGQATEAYQIMIADPTNNLYQAKKLLYPKMFDMTDDELDKIIGPEPQQGTQGAMAGMQPPGAPTAPGMPPPAGMPSPMDQPLPGQELSMGAPE